jgi:hypothetical protein|tara:strand:- start:310 stop:693 length:384 start_codon:yes stop_codon:yes gene_type:complete
MSEKTEELLDVDEEKLKYRINYIKENLLQMSNKLREEIPVDLTDQDLTEDNVFRNWIIVNSIYDAANKDDADQGFNRMLYFLFDKSKGNIARLVNNYDINIKLNGAGQLEDINLVVMETELDETNDE